MYYSVEAASAAQLMRQRQSQSINLFKQMKTLSNTLKTGAVAIATTVATFGLGGIAQAAPLTPLNANAGFANGLLSAPGYTGSSLSTATSLDFSSPITFGSIPPTYAPTGGVSAPNDFFSGQGAEINNATLVINTGAGSTILNLVSPTLPIANFLTFSTVAGLGSFTLTSFTTLTNSLNPNVLNLEALGTLNVPGFAPSPAAFLANFNQAGGAGNAVSYSGTLLSPPSVTATTVPEPSTILGLLAFAGLGGAALKRKEK
ncbi:MAG: PEP-CTERM sorting domain-containing protein [Microcystis aeruginosa W11-06]|nr:PEP-CTERM sorting domain-containing protein [Microcystis aeruginosa W11-03]NCR93856.1 PEP-CTERM sorting domain-containing protein [Microcystis aeruginosa W11-06]